MASLEALYLENPEPGDDPTCDQLYHVLDDGLQPHTQTSMEKTATSILDLLLQEGSYWDTRAFSMVCFEIAEQIPYNHPSMKKLVLIMDLVFSSERLQDEGSRRNPARRYFKLGEAYLDHRDDNDPSEEPIKYFRWQTLQAELQARDMLDAAFSASYAFKEAFDGKSFRELTGPGREACVFAASIWILTCGDSVYSEIPTDMTDHYSSDESTKKSTGLMACLRGAFTRSSAPKSYVDISPDQWRRWAYNLRAISRGEKDTEKFSFSDECKELAGRAGDTMFALQSRKLETLEE